jgi:hypothetical protein
MGLSVCSRSATGTEHLSPLLYMKAGGLNRSSLSHVSKNSMTVRFLIRRLSSELKSYAEALCLPLAIAPPSSSRTFRSSPYPTASAATPLSLPPPISISLRAPPPLAFHPTRPRHTADLDDLTTFSPLPPPASHRWVPVPHITLPRAFVAAMAEHTRFTE